MEVCSNLGCLPRKFISIHLFLLIRKLPPDSPLTSWMRNLCIRSILREGPAPSPVGNIANATSRPTDQQTMTDDTVPEKLQTNSQRYGNDKTIDEVFNREYHPVEPELVEALAETEHLTGKEAFAFAHGHFGQLPLPEEIEGTSRVLHKQGFESTAEFNAIKQRAKKKIGDAIWIYELIDAFRHPDFPEECTECSHSLGGMWIKTEEGSGPLCRNCADVDTEPFPQPWESENPNQ